METFLIWRMLWLIHVIIMNTCYNYIYNVIWLFLITMIIINQIVIFYWDRLLNNLEVENTFYFHLGFNIILYYRLNRNVEIRMLVMWQQYL